MEIQVKLGSLEKETADCLIIGIFTNKTLSPSAKIIDKLCDNAISQLTSQGDLTGALEQTLFVPYVPKLKAKRLLIVGCGDIEKFNQTNYLKVCRKAGLALRSYSLKKVICTLPELLVTQSDLHWKIRSATISLESAQYQFLALKSKAEQPSSRLEKMQFMVAGVSDKSIGEHAIQEGQAIAKGMHLARELGNLPGNICTPTYMAKQAKHLAKRYASIKTKILEEKDMEKLGMGALLAVASGSAENAKLIVMHYQGAKDSVKPIVLVGKGVTFDSGGISLKPGQGMDEMKFDMMGGACVLGTLQASAELGLPLNIIGVIPSTENLPGGRAVKPGDIVKSMSGKTIEILNTDAEGRLILCDALTYCEKFNPEMVIDIATLTGAMVVALGHSMTGIFTPNDTLAEELLIASHQTHDLAWRMPIHEQYTDELKSNFADLANIGGRNAGGSIAAGFLNHFTQTFKWAHLDIAGTAWLSSSEKGASGRPIPLLVQFLLNQCQQPVKRKKLQS